MKLKHVAVCLSVFAIFAISFSAFAEKKAKAVKSKKEINSEKAKMILEKAGKARISFLRTRVKQIDNQGVKITTEQTEWNKYYQDGTYANRLEAVHFDAKNKKISDKVYLTLSDGSSWTVIDNIAIKDAFLKKNKIEKRKEEINRNIIYKVENASFQNIPCFKITMQKNSDHKKGMMAVYYIDKEDYFKYYSEVFLPTGKKLGTLPIPKTIKKLKNSDIDDKLFTIPKTCRIIKAGSLKDASYYCRVASTIQKKRLDVKGADLMEKLLIDKYDVSNLSELLSITLSKEKK